MLSSIDMFSYVLLMSMFNVCLSVSLSITYDGKALKDLDHPEHFNRSENDGATYQKDVNGSVLVPFKSLNGELILQNN